MVGAGSSSAVSSMVTTRSPGSMRPRTALSSDVFPVDVAPLTMTLQRRDAHGVEQLSDGHAANASRGSERSPEPPDGQARAIGAIGGITAHTREPSGNRASTIGAVRSSRRPRGARMRSMTTARSAVVIWPARRVTPCRSIQTSPPLFTSTSSTDSSVRRASSAPKPSRRATAARTRRSVSTPVASGAMRRTWARTTVAVSPCSRSAAPQMAATRRSSSGRSGSAHAAPRSSRPMQRGRRARNSPASTARAIAGSTRSWRRRVRRGARHVGGVQRSPGFDDEHDPVRANGHATARAQGEVARTGDEQAPGRVLEHVAGGGGPMPASTTTWARRAANQARELGPSRGRRSGSPAPRGIRRWWRRRRSPGRARAAGGASDPNQSTRPWRDGSATPSVAGRSPARSTRIESDGWVRARQAETTVVPLPPLADQQMVTAMADLPDGGARAANVPRA